MRDQIGFFIVAIIYVAILFALVRPGSKGTVIIGSMTAALTDLVRGVTGQTFNADTNTWSVGNG